MEAKWSRQAFPEGPRSRQTRGSELALNNQDRERAQLESAQAECARLREENARLRRLLAECGMPVSAPEHAKIPGPTLEGADARPAVSNESAPDVKIALFRSLFRGREDVYAIRKQFQGRNLGLRAAFDQELEGGPLERRKRAKEGG
jgi:hypothetical protein